MWYILITVIQTYSSYQRSRSHSLVTQTLCFVTAKNVVVLIVPMVRNKDIKVANDIKCIAIPYSAGTVFIRHNLTSVDVRL